MIWETVYLIREWRPEGRPWKHHPDCIWTEDENHFWCIGKMPVPDETDLTPYNVTRHNRV